MDSPPFGNVHRAQRHPDVLSHAAGRVVELTLYDPLAMRRSWVHLGDERHHWRLTLSSGGRQALPV
jgi:hypothetical protein